MAMNMFISARPNNLARSKNRTRTQAQFLSSFLKLVSKNLAGDQTPLLVELPPTKPKFLSLSLPPSNHLKPPSSNRGGNISSNIKPLPLIHHSQHQMGTLANADSERAGAEIIYGAEACYQHSIEMLAELGFPKGVLPLKDLEECGLVRDTGFVWMKQKGPFEHYFKGTGTRVSYAAEVTAYVEKGKMKKMTGIKSKQMLLWVPITEMSSVHGGSKIYFKSAVGIGRAFPAAAFSEEEEGEGLNINGARGLV